MKNFFISLLLAGLFVTANSAWAQSDTKKKDKTPAKVEKAVKKADAPKESAVCCPEKKENCPFMACEKKDCPKDCTKPCCTEKKTDSKAAASCCTNKEATNGTKSSGKKAN